MISTWTCSARYLTSCSSYVSAFLSLYFLLLACDQVDMLSAIDGLRPEWRVRTASEVIVSLNEESEGLVEVTIEVSK